MKFFSYLLLLLLSSSAYAQSEEATIAWLKANYKHSINHNIPLGNGFFKSSYIRLKDDQKSTIQIFKAGYFKSPSTSRVSLEWTDMVELNANDLMWQDAWTFLPVETEHNSGGSGLDYGIRLRPNAKYRFYSKDAYLTGFGDADEYDLRTAGKADTVRLCFDGEENGHKLYIYLRALMYLSRITGGKEYNVEE